MADEIQDVNGVDGARLLSYIERIEHIEEEKKRCKTTLKKFMKRPNQLISMSKRLSSC